MHYNDPAVSSAHLLTHPVVFRSQVVVVTSDLAGAGTDSRVYLVMYGQDGSDSGRLSLDKAGINLFERAQRDTFEVGARVPPSEAGAAYDHAAADSYHL